MTTYKYDKGFLIHGDCVKAMKRIPSGSVDLVFTDPPYNIAYEYDVYSDNRTHNSYVKWTKEWVAECYRCLKPTGSMFVAIGDEYAADVKKVIDRSGMFMRNWIIWHYTFGVYCKTKFGRDHAHILYHVKDRKQFTFNGEAIRVPSARQTKYNDLRAEASGRVPGDVWAYPRVCGTFKERNDFGHKCQMPEELLERVVKVATDKKEIVLDPFGGTGTTAAVAARLNRRFITVELSPSYVEGIKLRLRKHAKPV
jgi:DNA modification methylase